jgi:exopolyphosphatase/guanosine-5'-triphosphate,3'-diphosphate pyrophosphatase
MVGLVIHSRIPAKSAAPLGQIRSRLPANLGGSHHERRVAAITVKLFDLLAPRHALSGKYRQLLHLAALLHDAGRVYGSEGHEHSGAALVLADRSLSLSPRQRRAIAYLVRHHRGPVPDTLSDQQILHSGDNHSRLRILLGILRASDALDSRRLRPKAIIIKRTARKLRITCLVRDQISKARRRLGGASKFALLEAEFGLRVRLRIKREATTAARS